MNKPNDKKVALIGDDNKIILIDEDDPRGFLVTDKTPKEVDEILKRYIKKTEPKVFMISTNTKKDKKDKNGITKKNQ